MFLAFLLIPAFLLINLNTFSNAFYINKSIIKNMYNKHNFLKINCLSNKKSKKNNFIPTKNIFKKEEQKKFRVTLQNKSKSFLKLIRYQNIAPTILLSFVGGWLMKPSLYNLFTNPHFIGASVNTLLIMSSSMIINDIYDLNIDKINNPNRPLVTGEIKIIEAYLFTFMLLGLSQYINITFLTESLQIITNLATIQILIYSPILKCILFIKNISCASLVSFAIFFAGLSATNQQIVINNNFGIFSLVLTFIFLGSLYNEILLDISDYEGDKINNIKTIPVVFGKQNAWYITHFLLGFNILMNTMALMSLYNIYIGSTFFIVSSPLLFRSMKIKQENLSNKSIKNAVSKTNIQLFIILLYFCFLIYI